jgi:uncharacterized membrane protein
MTQDSARWLLLLHLLTVLWLAGGVLGGAVVRAQTKRASELAQKVLGLRIAWRLATVLTLPGALLGGLTGIALIHPRGHDFKAGWIHVSLTLWLLVLGISLLYLLPHLKRSLAAAEASLAAGQPTPELAALAGKKLPAILADVNALALVVLSALMVLRPF